MFININTYVKFLNFIFLATFIIQPAIKAFIDIPTKELHSESNLPNGFKMPVYGFGTWLMGENNDPAKDAADIAALKAAIELGVTHFDTAELYGNGHAEELLGQAIKGHDRSKLFIVSKVKGENLAYENVLKSCKESLKRLDTPYLDLYLIHYYNQEISLEQTMKALDKLVDDGLVRNIGVSNFTKEHLAEAQSYSKHKIVCNQVNYNLQVREAEITALLEYCQKNNIFLVAWGPLQLYPGVPLFSEGIPSIIDSMCSKYNKKPRQIALNWLIAQDNVVTIAKTCNIDHLKENLGAIGWKMEAEDIEELRRKYPNKYDSFSVPLG